MAANAGNMIVGSDAVVTAAVRNCRRLEVFGYLDGDVIAESVVVHAGGQVFGSIRAAEAEVLGTVQGHVTVKNLIAIRSTGTVTGNVRYGRLMLESGGNLSAEVKNVPPRLVGDFALAVGRGGSVKLTALDVSAVDPDDDAHELTYEVSGEKGGHLAMCEAKGERITRFSQQDVNQGRVCFVHDASAPALASFAVTVSDAAGAVAGAPRTIDVTVLAAKDAV